VLATDALAQPPAKPSDIVVETTIFDGKVVYERTRVRQ
jgi:predicted amidohydrolase YtcJ